LAVVDKELQNKSKKKVSKKKSMSQKEQPTTASLQPAIIVLPLVTPQALISYEWSGGNSCFFDVGLALWFEAFSRWPQGVCEALLKSLPSDTVLASVFNHFERCNKWLATGKGDLVNRRRELSLGQGMARRGIFEQLNLYETAGSYGCSRTWLRCGVMVRYHCVVVFFTTLISLFAGASRRCPDTFWYSTPPDLCLSHWSQVITPCLEPKYHIFHYLQ
jgi:hypothetical protein